MQVIKARLSFLFTSTRGLVLVAIAMISLVTGFFGFLSGPMEEFGVRSFMINNLGLSMLPAEQQA